MADLEIAYILIPFAILGIGLIFTIAWIISSESKINFYKAKMKDLRAQIESYEKEKIMLPEMANDLEYSLDEGDHEEGVQGSQQETERKSDLLLQVLEQNAALEKENKSVKLELSEAKDALEEIYKAVIEKNSEANSESPGGNL